MGHGLIIYFHNLLCIYFYGLIFVFSSCRLKKSIFFKILSERKILISPIFHQDNLESLLNGIAEHNKLENSSKPDAAQKTVKSTCPTVPILGYSIQDFIHKLTSITKFNKGIAGISAMQVCYIFLINSRFDLVEHVLIL